MRPIARGAEALYSLLLLAGLVAPLVYFYARVAPWQSGATASLASEATRAALIHSLELATASSVLSTGFAFVFSWALWRFEWPRGLARTVGLLLKIPYLLPSFFFAFGWIALAAPTVGYLNRALSVLGLGGLPSIYGLGGTIFVEVLWSTALAMIQLQPFFAQFPGQLEDAAVMCGAGPARAFFKITLPLARPQLLSALLLTSVSALSAFGVPAMLASPARVFVLTTRIYQGIKSSHDFSQAGLLSLILLALTLLILALQRALGARRAPVLVAGKAGRPSQLAPGWGARVILGGAALFALLSCVLPGAAIALQSLLRDPSDLASLSLDKYLYVFTRTPDGWLGLRNSLVTSVTAAAVATALGLIIAYADARLHARVARALVELWNIGYALPGTVIALTLLVFYSGSLTDTLWILALAYLVKYAAFALRTLVPALTSVSAELEEAAWMCGASPRRAFFGILTPMLMPAVAAALVLALVPMLSELTMSVLLVGPGTDTLGSLIYKLQEYADPGSAAVLAVTAASAILALNALMKRLSKGAFGI